MNTHTFQESPQHAFVESTTHTRNLGPNYPIPVGPDPGPDTQITNVKTRIAVQSRGGFDLFSAFRWQNAFYGWVDLWGAAWNPDTYRCDTDGSPRRWSKMEIVYAIPRRALPLS